jgi:hypothetical protein
MEKILVPVWNGGMPRRNEFYWGMELLLLSHMSWPLHRIPFIFDKDGAVFAYDVFSKCNVELSGHFYTLAPDVH